MSNRLMTEVWNKFPGGGPRLAVLQAIADLSSDGGTCYVTMEEIGWVARMHRIQVCNILKWLRAERWVFTHKQSGQGRTLVYRINTVKLEATPKRVRYTEDDELMRAVEKAKVLRRKRHLRRMATLLQPSVDGDAAVS